MLEAAEHLLIEAGHAGITSRVLAEKAGVNNELVHDYFASTKKVFLQVLERFADRLVEREQAMLRLVSQALSVLR